MGLSSGEEKMRPPAPHHPSRPGGGGGRKDRRGLPGRPSPSSIKVGSFLVGIVQGPAGR